MSKTLTDAELVSELRAGLRFHVERELLCGWFAGKDRAYHKGAIFALRNALSLIEHSTRAKRYARYTFNRHD
jgi:hypothetical protein